MQTFTVFSPFMWWNLPINWKCSNNIPLSLMSRRKPATWVHLKQCKHFQKCKIQLQMLNSRLLPVLVILSLIFLLVLLMILLMMLLLLSLMFILLLLIILLMVLLLLSLIFLLLLLIILLLSLPIKLVLLNLKYYLFILPSSLVFLLTTRLYNIVSKQWAQVSLQFQQIA